MVGNMSQTAGNSFTYDNNLTPQISGLSPHTTTVIGELRVICFLGAFINCIHPFDNLSVRQDHYKALPRWVNLEECLDYVPINGKSSLMGRTGFVLKGQ